MKGKSDFDYEDKVFLKCDPYQYEHIVVGFRFRPGQTKLEISYCGDMVVVYEFEVSKEKDTNKALDIQNKNDDED